MAHTSSATADTPRLRFYLLGRFRVESEIGPIHLPRRKVESLLAYLLLHPETHPREKLAALFWGDSPDAEARHSLRTALATLRQDLGTDLLLADRDTVQLNPAYPLWSDVHEFEQRSNAEASLSNLRALISLYQGDLLADFYDDWLTPEREQYRSRYLEALLRLTQEMRSRHDYEQAIEFARQVLRADPSNERAHQHLMFCLAASGDRSAALAQYESCRQVLQTDLSVEPLPETTALYQWIKQSPGERPSLEARLTNLPIPLTSFIGRQRELAEIKQLISPLSQKGRGARGEGSRLLTLTGAGGSGKTRLAIQATTELLDAFPDGVWWVELAALSDPQLVLQVVAKVLGVRPAPNQPLAEALIDFLRSRRLLLVLDNCEHLVAACAQLAATLLSVCPHLQILTTSREALGLTGEITWPVPPLAVPEPQPLPLLKPLLQFEGIQLFMERGMAVKPDFDLTLQNAPVVVKICRHLDGIPLALELAAARVKVLPVEQLADRLNDRFNLLTQGSRTELPRHQTLRATIGWSYELLTEPERVLFRRLAVFAGGFTLEAAESIGAGDAEQGSGGAEEFSPLLLSPSAPLLDLLTHLVDKSLVMVDTPEYLNGARYKLLETIRQYAWEELLASGEVAWMRDRHLAFFLEWTKQAEPKLHSAEQLSWLNRLEAEHDNLRAALAWSLESGQAEAGLHLAVAIGSFWCRYGYISEGREWITKMLAHSEQVSDLVRAQALFKVGQLVCEQGDYQQSLTLAQQSLGLFREMGDKAGVASCLFLLSIIANDQGDRPQAVGLLEESLNLARQLEDEIAMTQRLLELQDMYTRLGELQRAAEYAQEGLTLARKHGNKTMIAFALGGLGDIARRRNDYLQATTLFQEALAIASAVEDPVSSSYILEAIALTLLGQGQAERAMQLMGAAEALRQAINAPLPPAYQADYAPSLALARASLGDAAFAAAWGEGRAMSFKQAVAYALAKA